MSRLGLSSNRLRWFGGLALLLLSGAAIAAEPSKYNMPVGVTDISREVYDLHMTVFWWCVAIGVVVFGAMIWSIIRHRKSVHPKPADFHESTTVEIIWTIIPFVILILMAVPAAGTLIRMEDTSNSELTVKVTGYQWFWEYEYVGTGVKFFSRLDEASNKARQLKSGIDPKTVPHYLKNVDKPLVLPVDTKVRFVLTSNDVLHAWWLPDLALKKDAIPGYINELWTKIDEEGTYRGKCAELCGRDHGFMPVVVEAVSKDKFTAWMAEQSGETTATANNTNQPAAQLAQAAAAQ